MSVSAAKLRELTALGLAGDALIRVFEIIEEASAVSADVSALSADKSADNRRGPLESTANDALERRRNADKLAKRAKRAAAKLSAKLSADKADMSADKPLLDSVVLPSSLLTGKPLKKARGTENARARGTRLAPGTPLSDAHRAIIIAEGIHNPEKFWEEFVNYWSEVPGRYGVKLLWDGTLRNRCREVIKRGFNGHGPSANRANSASSNQQSGSAAILAGVAAATERRARERGSSGPGTGQAPQHADASGVPRLELFGARDG
jgi:hypothetical protein